MYFLIIILPLTSFFILSCFGRFFYKKDLLIVSISCILLAFFFVFFILMELQLGLCDCLINCGFFFEFTFLSCPIILLYDELCIFMCFIILCISFLVHVYSLEYMKYDIFIVRFISYLSLFTFFMLILVTAGTLIQLFIGWEGVGLVSYLLINFWFTRIQASKSSLKAVLMNRFGDISLYGVLVILINWYGCLDFLSLTMLFQYNIDFLTNNFFGFKTLFQFYENGIFYFFSFSCMDLIYNILDLDIDILWTDSVLVFINTLIILFKDIKIDWINYIYILQSNQEFLYLWNNKFFFIVDQPTIIFNSNINWVQEVLALLIMIAVIGKSAQIGLHTWLPDAMEGPTPVSALIHAATMVTAGVFILIRFFSILDKVNLVLSLIIIIGASTIFFAGIVGSYQFDLKKIIAYSTCSQLGYMVVSCGISNYSISLFHLMNHAFFKALLFLGAGAIIHAINDEQDIRKMGGLWKLMPFTYIIMFFSSLALIGIPFLSGFYSKDLLIENIIIYNNFIYFYVYILCLLGIFYTIYYSICLLKFSFFNRINLQKVAVNILESNLIIFVVLCILFFFSIFIGFCMNEWLNLMYSLNSIWIDEVFLNSEFILNSIKMLPSLLILFFFFFNFFIIFWFKKIKVIYFFFNQKWYFDFLYNNYIIWCVFHISYFFTFKLLDRAILENVTSMLFSKVYKISLVFYLNTQGYVYYYIFILWNFFIWIFFFFDLYIGIDFIFIVYYLFIYIYTYSLKKNGLNKLWI